MPRCRGVVSRRSLFLFELSRSPSTAEESVPSAPSATNSQLLSMSNCALSRASRRPAARRPERGASRSSSLSDITKEEELCGWSMGELGRDEAEVGDPRGEVRQENMR